MKKLFFTAIVSLVALAASAIPARPGVLKSVLPDGSELNIKLYGDENFHFATTEDDYLLVSDADGFYCYAKKTNNAVVNTGVRAKNIAERTQEHVDLLNSIGKYSLDAVELIKNRQTAAARRAVPASQKTAKTARSAQAPKGLAILVNFSDKSFTHTRQEFDDMLNKRNYKDNGNFGSGKEYFEAQSNGTYSPSFDVFGPYTLNHNMAYYGAETDYDNDSRPAQMILDAVTKLSQDPNVSVNFADYDADNDGYIDNVFVYYAGYAESNGASSNTIWPHRWVVYSGNATGSTNFGGKILYDYACGSELEGTYGTSMSGLGTFCHEFSHVLGLPDLYITDYGSDHKTMGYWDIMDQGCYNGNSRCPAGYSSYERFFCNWLTPELINSPENCELIDLTCSNKAYIVTQNGKFTGTGAHPNPVNFVMLENRQYTDWDANLPYHGMLATMIRYSSSKWNANTVNNTESSMGVDIIEAYVPSSYSYSQLSGSGLDVYPGTRKVRELTLFSSYELTEITEESKSTPCGAKNVINFKFMGGRNDIFTVKFETRGLGSCNVKSLTEAEMNAGVTLPTVTPNGTNIFVGWSTDGNATSANAGVANSLYHPTENVRLFAVYIDENGNLVDDNTPYFCFDESGAGFINKSTTIDVSSSLDTYTELKGWTGSKVYCDSTLIKVGTSSRTGELITPPMNISGDIRVSFTAHTKESAVLTIYTDNQTLSTLPVNLTATPLSFNLKIEGVPAENHLHFVTESGEFFIKDITICGVKHREWDDIVAVDNAENQTLILYRLDAEHSCLLGAELGESVQCFDAVGRLIWSATVDSEQFTFTRPQGFYIIRVGNKSIKGI